jgi:digeranylgeranylglycerophospholipid reductase
LNQFIKNSFLSDRFANAKLLEVQGGGVPLAAPLKTQYADHIILVGDAARHVNPITGGGIHTALSGASVAGHFLTDHLSNSNDFSAKALKGYQDKWLETMGHHMWKLYEIKKDIFRKKKSGEQDARLFETMSNYFSPNSEFKKV